MGIFTTPKFEISGYEEPGDFSLANVLNTKAYYELQVPPDKFDISIGKERIPPKHDAEGNVLVKGAPGKEKKNGVFRSLLTTQEYFLICQLAFLDLDFLYIQILNCLKLFHVKKTMNHIKSCLLRQPGEVHLLKVP